MRIVFFTGAAVFLAACSMSSTPTGGDCATRASTELSALQSAIQATEVNIARGYTLDRQIEENGQITQVQVPLNTAKENQKLANLNARLGDVQARTNVAMAQCR